MYSCLSCCLVYSQKDILSNSSLKNVKEFSFENIDTYGKVIDCYDGDTCRISFYYKDELIQTKCRMVGYDSPEIKVSTVAIFLRVNKYILT